MSGRIASAIILAQFFVVVICFLILGIVMKFNGYPSDASGLIRWLPYAVFFREHGLWLVLVPLGWGSFAITANRIERGPLSDTGAVVLGILLALAIFLIFLWAILNPFTRPMLLDLSPLSPSSH